MKTHVVTPQTLEQNDDGYLLVKAEPGDTVRFEPGTYLIKNVNGFRTKLSGTASRRIRFEAATRYGALINTVGPAKGKGFAWENFGSFVDIEGFDITSTQGSCRIGILNRGANVRIVGNHVHGIVCTDDHNGGAGIDHTGSDCETVGNLIHDVKFVGDTPNVILHGIYYAAPRGRVWNNICFDVRDYGIHLYHLPVTDIVVANNLVFRARHGMYVGTGSDTQAADFCLVSNTIIRDVSGFGIVQGGGGSVGSHNYYLRNLFKDCGSGPFSNGFMGLVPDIDMQELVGIDPKFVDYKPDGTGNYSLAADSPCRDAGTWAGAPPVDFENKSRPSGKRCDIGPYEFQS